MATNAKPRGLFDPQIIGVAALDALRKLDPRALAKNPVIFVTEMVSVVVTGFFIRDIFAQGESPWFSGQIAFWLWFTVLFANFAEAVAEGRGKAQADALRKTRTDTMAKKLASADARDFVEVPGIALKVGDIVLCDAGDLIPSDGEVIEGVASVD